MLRAFQIIGSSSSRFVSSPLLKWKPLIFIKSSYSSRAASPMLFPITSTGWNIRSFRISAIHSESKSDDASVSPSQALAHLRKVSFCGWCGGTMKHTIPDGDDKMRDVCTQCGRIAYQNPKMQQHLNARKSVLRRIPFDEGSFTTSSEYWLGASLDAGLHRCIRTHSGNTVVGCLVEHEDKILLCKRKIQPSYGLWTLPSGFLELGESAVQGAARETWEEAGAEVEVKSPFAQLDIPYIGHSYFFFRAKLKKPHFAPGPESLECRLFAPDDIPFDSLAFSSMVVSLNWYIEDLKAGITPFHYCTIKKRSGSGPSDICAYTLDNHLQC